MKNRRTFVFLFSCFLVFSLFSISGCQPTYPEKNLVRSVIGLCQAEYGIDIKAELVGHTLAIYLPLEGLLDLTFSISEKARENIMNVVLSASRVVLSTDADVRFYCVMAQDQRLPEIQLIIIKYTEDVKRAYYMDISRDEYFKRMLMDIAANPQAQKEEVIKRVFKKFNLEKEWQEEILNDFFRTTPLNIKDMGYWQGKFYIKDINLDEFLAEQMAYRIRIKFREDEDMYKGFFLKAADSKFIEKEGKRFFNVVFDIRPRAESAVSPEKHSAVIFENVLREISNTTYGYSFKGFDFAEMANKDNGLRLLISREDLYAFRKNRLPLDKILATVHE